MIAVLAGLVAGALSGLLGVGGGVLLVPAMVLLFGFNQHKAHGTSLAVIIPIATLGALSYFAHGSLDWMIALQLAIGGILGAGVGARLANALPSQKLRKLFALFVLLVGLKMLCDAAPVIACGGQLAVSAATGAPVWLIVTTGFAAGVLSGLLGVGGGIIIVPALIYLLHLDQRIAQGISLLVIIPISISGAVVHFTKGNVDLAHGKWLAIGGIAGTYLGALLAHQWGDAILRLVFGVFLLLMSVLTFRKR